MTRRTLFQSALGAGVNNKLFADSEPPVARNEIQQYMRAYDVPGISIAFLRGDQILYSQGFGVADRSTRAPVVQDSLFRIASNSKAFTSASIFLLIEAGKLNLSDRVFSPDGILHQYSGEGSHRDWLHAITIHHLLTHTAGGWSNESNDPMFEVPGLNQEELIAAP